MQTMSVHWKKQLQGLIDLAEDRIRRIESGEMATADIGPPVVDTSWQTIEAERAMIERLQQTIERLNAAAPTNCPVQPRLAASR
ncbi:hypothetical protein ACF1BQ_027840 [Bradyrhizobium sp. RDT10]